MVDDLISGTMMVKKLLLAGIAFAAVAGPATAADLARPVYRAPVAVAAPIYTWTGFYIGGHLGTPWATVDQTATATSAGGLNVTHNAPQTLNNGFLGGVQVGYNYQVAQWVLGAEAQFSWTNLDTNNPCAVGGVQNPVASTLLATCHAKIDSFGTAAGRLGWATDRMLLYVKGGGAWARDHFDYSSQTFTGFLTPLDSISDTRWGWMAGIGSEYALDGNWSAKIEYDFLDLGTKTYNLPVVTSLLPTAVHTQDIRERIQLIKVGLNYKFGYAAAPVGVYK